jgi:hypothetical protein
MIPHERILQTRRPLHSLHLLPISASIRRERKEGTNEIFGNFTEIFFWSSETFEQGLEVLYETREGFSSDGSSEVG